jgi:tetratricopeptide (TPR) repeat protein
VSFDDYPKRDRNSQLSQRADAAFEQAVAEVGRFVIQQPDRHDYGTDFHLEATHSESMTNLRVHAQMKGTDKAKNKDGSVSIQVAVSNLRYLLSHPNSIYVCFHSPTRELLVRSAEDVFRDAEHNNEGWGSQDSLTVRFLAPFDAQFQADFHARTIAASSRHRDDRLKWTLTTPEQFSREVAVNVLSIDVPASRDEALVVLRSLYESGRDDVISKAFDQFLACFGPDHPGLNCAYLSEINLAMRGKVFSLERISAAIDFIKKAQPDDPPEALFNRANCHSALRQDEAACELYKEAIRKAGDLNPRFTADCWKNLGAAIDRQGNHSEARLCYERAIALVPDLMEAHFELAMSRREVGDWEEALRHFEYVVWASNEASAALEARGSRLEIYFRLGMVDKAFEDISVLLTHGDKEPWVFDRCARAVYNYARSDESSISRAIRFWDSYLRMRPRDRDAQKERLLCFAYAKMHQQSVPFDYARYVAEVSAFLEADSTDAAHLWDRVGHWAEEDGDWEQAELQYRKAYSLEPNNYGHCLGVALNALGRFDQALPILMEQATMHHPTANSWFEVGRTQERIGDISACKESYQRVLDIDPEHASAVFGLGGAYWNGRLRDEAIDIWSDAIRRFPSHPSAAKLRRDLPQFFDDANDDDLGVIEP